MKYEAYHVTWIYPDGKRKKQMHVLQLDDNVTIDLDKGTHVIIGHEFESLNNVLVMSIDEYELLFKVPHRNCPKLSGYEYEKMIDSRFNLRNNVFQGER